MKMKAIENIYESNNRNGVNVKIIESGGIENERKCLAKKISEANHGGVAAKGWQRLAKMYQRNSVVSSGDIMAWRKRKRNVESENGGNGNGGNGESANVSGVS